MEIKKLVEYPDAKAVLIHGQSGSGKTTLAATAPGPILFVDVEGGLTGLSRTDGIEFAVVRNIQDVRQVYTELVAMKEMKYKTIIIDSMTMIGQWVIDEVKQGKEKQLSMGEWGTVVERINALVKAFRDFPLKKDVNLIMTSLTKEEQDEDQIYKRPDIVGKASSSISALVDAVLYTFTQSKDGKIQYKVLTKDTGKVAAKVRSSALGLVVDADLTNIINILNQKEETKDEKREPAKVA